MIVSRDSIKKSMPSKTKRALKKDPVCLKMEQYTKVSGLVALGMAMASRLGLMGLVMRGSGRTTWPTVAVYSIT